ncbi:MAG: ParB/RepB/Spo0J family partition protein [Calditrichaceae bacterium]|nr:ParB/RepB/Spo0J family partition protein [Calditrichaceae bacterium]MBN2707516.1 ParB/RepB/Spo0J family partition protein [Calditrichaceae bacterium]RQV95605.1 MAG: ParB/RepB/Spo0J family partition protein [Calditrichota bacterium]
MTKAKPSRLGRGLSALIPETDTSTAELVKDGHLSDLEVALIRPNPYQPRMEFDPESLEELKKSISEKGVIQPITVRKADKGYELVAGERRLRAVVELDLPRIPAYIIKVDTKEEMMELAIIENVQREKLNPIEQAKAYQRLIDECKLTQDDVARKIGKERSTITNIIRLLKLPEKIQDSVQKEMITMGHARALLGVEDRQIQLDLWNKAIRNGLSVRKVEQLVQEAQIAPKNTPKKASKRSVFLQKAEDELREIFGTKVNIRPKKEGGAIEIEYYSPEDLNRLLELFEEVSKVS